MKINAFLAAFAGFGAGMLAATLWWVNTPDLMGQVASECMNRLEAHFEEFHPEEWAQAKSSPPDKGQTE